MPALDVWGYSCHMDIAHAKNRLECFFDDLMHHIMAQDTLVKFLRELVSEIDMKAYGAPLLEHFGTGKAKGWSAVQLIETSCITLHTCDDSRNMHLDVFSCKEFDPEVVKAFMQRFWCPEKISYHFIPRVAPKCPGRYCVR